MRNPTSVALFARLAAVAGLAAALAAASPVSAATTLSTTGIVTDAFTANGNVNFDDASADTILIGQNGGTPDVVTIAGDVSLTDSQWGITAAGAGTFASLNGLQLTSNSDGFSVAGGTTSRTLTVSGGNLGLTLTGATSLTLPTTGTLATLAGTETLTNKTLTSPTINGGSMTGLTAVSLADGAAHVLSVTSGVLSANGSLQISAPLSTTMVLGGNLQTSGSFTTSGGSITLAATGLTGVTLPTSGTLATLAGTETLTNKTLTAPVISSISNTGTLTLPSSTDTLVGRATTDTLTNKTLTSPRVSGIKDLNGNDILLLNATAGAVNGFQLFNAGTGIGPTVMVTGTDANADMRIQAKGSGGFLFLDTAASGDMLKLQPQTGGAATFQGTLTSADLTGNQSWAFPNASGTVALLSDIPSSGVTGNGAAGGVSFWTGASALANDSANLFWDNTLKALGIGTNNPTTALVVADNNGAVSNPSTVLTLTHGTTGTAANGTGTGIMFRAENASGTVSDAAQIAATLDTATAGAEDTSLRFFTRSAGAAAALGFVVSPTGSYSTGSFSVLGSTSLGDAVGDAITFNAATASILDHLSFDAGTLYIDALNNRVGVGNSFPSALFSVGSGNPFQIDASGNVATTGTVTATGTVAASGGITIGSGTAILKHLSVETSIDLAAPGSVPGCTESGDIAVTGAALGNTVVAAMGVALPPNFLISGYVAAADVVHVRLCQFAGASPADPDGAGTTYRVDVWKH